MKIIYFRKIVLSVINLWSRIFPYKAVLRISVNNRNFQIISEIHLMFYSQFPLADTTVQRIINPELHSFYAQTIQKLMKITSYSENRFPASNPVSCLRKDLRDIRNSRNIVPWFATEKSDGVRFFLVLTCSPQKDPIALLVDRSWGIFILPGLTFSTNLFISGTILDTELICERPSAEEQSLLGSRPTLWLLLAFDLLVASGEALLKAPFLERYSALQSVLSNHYKPKVGVDVCLVRSKKFVPLVQLPWLVNEIHNNLRHDNDGLILQNGHSVYTPGMQKTVLKWKQKEKHTVDFLCHSIQQVKPEQWMVDLFVLDSAMQLVRAIQIVVSRSNCQQLGLNDVVELDMAILECYWNDRHGWRPLKLRQDKAEPNTEFTLRKTQENIEENIRLEELLELATTVEPSLPPVVEALDEDLASVLDEFS